MSMTDSPDLEYYPDGKPPTPEKRSIRPTTIIIALLAVAVVGLLAFNFLPEAGFGGGQSGSISGQVVTPSGTPIPDVILYVEGALDTAVTGADGRFTLPSVPAGAGTLVLGVTPDPPQFRDITVSPQQNTDLGSVVLE